MANAPRWTYRALSQSDQDHAVGGEVGRSHISVPRHSVEEVFERLNAVSFLRSVKKLQRNYRTDGGSEPGLAEPASRVG